MKPNPDNIWVGERWHKLPEPVRRVISDLRMRVFELEEANSTEPTRVVLDPYGAKRPLPDELIRFQLGENCDLDYVDVRISQHMPQALELCGGTSIIIYPEVSNTINVTIK